MARRVRTQPDRPKGAGLFAPDAPTSSTVALTRSLGPASDGPVNIAERRDPCDRFYRALSALREDFHRIGRFDDANAKLDELCKLLVLKVLDARHPLDGKQSRLGADYLGTLAQRQHGDRRHVAAAMHDVFAELAARFPQEVDGFGPHSRLNIRLDDDDFAAALIPVLDALPSDDANGHSWSFDSVNEAFGHFVQDSFRNRKEDAQYMTPPEVVSAIIEVAFQDILANLQGRAPEGALLIADPTCGVGSFLAAAYRQALRTPVAAGTLADHLALFGQDKVDRMVRLANVNLRIFAGVRANIRQGNSILPAASLDDLQGEVDLIATNPPFGATFESADLLRDSKPAQYPALHAMARGRMLPKTVDSEYVLLDRELALLKPGGRILMVVPDHVVSGSGFSEDFRLTLQRFADLVAVFDLPTETFAQAGTRTKTSVVYLRRVEKGVSPYPTKHVFMATSEDLGFRVVSRTGASVKRIVGANDMERITAVYKTFRASAAPVASIVCLNKTPSVAAVSADHLLNNRWTAGFYQAERLQALEHLEQTARQGFHSRRLLDVAILDPGGAERVLADEHNRCISVLHVKEDGCIDLRAVQTYHPTTPCQRCERGDVLLSKINPRIMRVCVVPPAPWRLGCSSEFAVLRTSAPDITPWMLLLLLRSDVVQAQIRTLTSGTSSSHNRIKDRDLGVIDVPVPKKTSPSWQAVSSAASQLEKATMQQYAALEAILRCFSEVDALLQVSE